MDEPVSRDMELFFEVYSGLPRQGPGNAESTAKAFSLFSDLPARPRILDLGCGTGKQTIDLAGLTDGEITALDNHKPYLDELTMKVKDDGLEDRVKVVHGDMCNLAFESNSFDLIWAEGSIFIIGFKGGLEQWKPLLRKGGYLAVSELTWLKPSPPREVAEYLIGEYPPLTTAEKNLDVVRSCGYKVVGHFALPESAWWDDYYIPLEKRVGVLQEEYADNKEMLAIIAEARKEIDIYRRFSEFYGYVFYVCHAV